MKATQEMAGSGSMLKMCGELSVRDAEGFRAALKDALDSLDHVVLNLEEVTGVDLSILQLICSAHLSSQESNKRLSLSGALPEAIQRVVRIAGFVHPVGCRKDSFTSCLWSEGCK